MGVKDINPPESPTAASICAAAGTLVSGERDRTHGEKIANHTKIARLWDAYLANREAGELTALDVAHMMVLLKVARTQSGALNPDDWIDGCGYMACAGEIAYRLRSS